MELRRRRRRRHRPHIGRNASRGSNDSDGDADERSAGSQATLFSAAMRECVCECVCARVFGPLNNKSMWTAGLDGTRVEERGGVVLCAGSVYDRVCACACICVL